MLLRDLWIRRRVVITFALITWAGLTDRLDRGDLPKALLKQHWQLRWRLLFFCRRSWVIMRC